MSLDVYSRRKYKQGKFVYLLDDEDKTAWIEKGHIGRCRKYRLPDHVMIDGERYTIESVEAGAYNKSRTLRHLTIPDTFNYVDEWAFDCNNLRSVYIGKGLDYLDSWTFCHYEKLHHFQIDKDNTYLKYENDMVLSKDGKKLLAAYIVGKCPSQLNIPDGVDEIGQYVFIGSTKLESVTFPSTLRKMGDNSFGMCQNLRSVVLPEGFEKFVTQSFAENDNLTYVDLPSTLTDLGYQTFVCCPNLEKVVLRSPKKLKFECSFVSYIDDTRKTIPYLYVPADFVEQYRQDKEWSVFSQILPIE